MKHGSAHNPYENLTLDHIKDEQGKPITVHSERQLHEAEKRYGFTHAASWGLEDTPPLNDPDAGDVTRDYKRKFQRDPAAYQRGAWESSGVSTGIAANASETLAHRSNPV